MEMKKILWPTDFSKSASAALPYVNSLTQKFDAEVHVLYVIEDISRHGPWYGDFGKEHMEKLREWEEETAHKHLDDICQKHLDGCRLYIKHVAIGDPAQEILKFVENENVDMVVMAKHGRKAHFAFGSVADKVVKHSPVPVVTIPVGKE